MSKHAVSFMELHAPFFMQGSSLGTKVSAAAKGAKLLLDDDRNGIWVYFKQKVAFIPLPSVASIDLIDIPKDVGEALEVNKPAPAQTKQDKKALAALALEQAVPFDAQVPIPDFDPTDEVAAATHRAMVRAASRNSNRAAPHVATQNDQLIQESRAATTQGAKGRSAQVQTPQQVAATHTGVQGKPKPISHSALNAQIKAEEKATR